MLHPREHDKYVRCLELMALLTEDMGKIAQNTNDYFDKGMNVEDLERARLELTKILSPLNEMSGLLDVEIKKRKAEGNHAERIQTDD